MASQGDLLYRNHADMNYPRALAAIYRNRLRIPDPSYAFSREPDAESMVMRDADIAHALMFRWRSIAGDDHRVEPCREDPGAELRAEVEDGLLGEIVGLRDALYNLARADLSGERFGRIVLKPKILTLGDGKARRWAVPVAVKDVPKERFWVEPRIEGHGDARRVSTTRKIYSVARDDWVEIRDPTQFIRVVVDDSEERLGRGRGLIEPLYHWWYAKTHLFMSMTQAADRHGQGTIRVGVKGIKDASSGKPNTEVVKDWINVLRIMRQQNVLVGDLDDEVAMLEGSGTGWQLMKDLMQMILNSISQLLLGAVLPTGGGGESTGSFARAEVEKSSMEVIIGSARANLEERFGRGLFTHLARVNHANYAELGIAGAPMGKMRITQERHQDTEKNARVLQTVLSSGVSVRRDEAYEMVGLTPPREGDEVIKPTPVQQPVLPGMDL